MNLLTIKLLTSTALVFGTPLLFRYISIGSLFYLIKKSWLILEEIRQSLWFGILELLGDDPFTVFTIGSILLTTVICWTIGFLFTFMDLYLKPSVLRKYKIQPGKNEPMDRVQLKKVVAQILFNQMVGIPLICLGGLLVQYRDPPSMRQLPRLHWALAETCVFLLLGEVIYYHLHRLLHNEHLYEAIHKRHHEWTSPTALVAFYCHPIEHLIINLGSFFFVPFVFNAHVSSYLTWFATVFVILLIQHSGYHFPFISSSKFHDFHHISINNNFGVIGIMDKLHKTDGNNKESVSESKHSFMKSQKSAREHFPHAVDGGTLLH